MDRTLAPAQQDAAGLVFFALVIWREARGEPLLAQAGVAHSILNRVARPSWWGRSLLEVLFKRLQFSSMTDPKDRQLTTWPVPGTASWPAWLQAMDVASSALAGTLPNPVPGADTYHDVSIETPASWGSPRFVGQLGRIRFFDVDQDVEPLDVKWPPPTPAP